MGCSSSSMNAQASGPHQKFHEVYMLGRKLGEGAFGQVRNARKRGTQDELAVKIVDVRARDHYGEPMKGADQERVVATKQEVDVWQAVGRSTYTVELQEHYYEKHLFYMVMEKCACSLMDKLSNMSTMLESDFVRIFSEMLLGIKHVHQRRIAHRDIKPDNFLFGGPDGGTVKLCDFGLAARLPLKKPLKGVFGTAPYMSPEMLTSGYDEKTDVWSFGATAFLMIHGDFPYMPKEATAPAMKKLIIAGKPEIQFNRPPDEDNSLSPAFVDRATPFLQALLQRSPSTRKSAEQALDLAFLRPATKAEPEIICQSEAADEAPLAPAFRKARKATKNFKEQKVKADPIAQRTLDDLLTKLDDANRGESFFFSETDEKDEERRAEKVIHEKSDDRIHSRSQRRFSTHSGVVSKSFGGGEDAGESTGTGDADDSSACSGDDRRPRAQTQPAHPHQTSPAERGMRETSAAYGGSH